MVTAPSGVGSAAMDELRARIAAQALEVAAGWSPAGAPASWALTAALFRAMAQEDALLDLATAIPLDRLPPLLLSAAIRHQAFAADSPLAQYFPVAGGVQPPLDDAFVPSLVAFARDQSQELAALCREHRYQMNEVRRCADVVAALAGVDRPIALLDLGTGCGLALQLDRYRYRFGDQVLGDPGSPVELVCDVRGTLPPLTLPDVVARVGVDVEPLDLGVPGVQSWLAACIPPEIGAVDRFAAACAMTRAHPAPLVRGDASDLESVMSNVSDLLPDDALLVVLDSYVHVFFTDGQRAAFRAALAGLGRDVDWVSVDPLVPLGADARDSVQGLPVPSRALEACRAGVTGVVGRVSVREGRSSGRVLGLAHPSAQWLEWF